MRAYEFLVEDQKIKSIVVRRLNKMPDDSPIFADVYKKIIGEPLGNRMSNYINARGDQDAIKASKWLLQTIPTLGDSTEIKEFVSKFSNPEFDPIDIKQLIPSDGMETSKDIMSVITDPFAQKLFSKIFQEFAGKGDAGAGEAAFAILSPRITYSSPGDISINGQKIEVKASRSASGKAGRIWDSPVNQTPMIDILSKIGKTSFTVLEGEIPFPDPELSKSFIQTACTAWFGKLIPEIEKQFGTSGFKDVWQKYVFETYKEESGWQGLLALGVNTYQYVSTGDQFVRYMKKSQQGNICRQGTKQSRELAPQILIK